MAVMPPEFGYQARAALREIVSAHGPEALSSPARMSNLLNDLLPDAPGIARTLVAAAEDHVADALREHVSHGMDAATAARLCASSFSVSTMFTPDVCAWVVGEFAIALGLITSADEPPAFVVPADPGAPGRRAGAGADGPAVIAQPPEPEPARRPTSPAPARVPASPLPATAPGTGAHSAPGHARSRRPRALVLAIAVAGVLLVAGAITVYSLGSGTPHALIVYAINDIPGTVTPIDLATGTLGTPIKAGKYPYAVAITPDGKTAYVANYGSGTVTPIDLATGIPSTPIRAGQSLDAIAITPNGKTAYVANNFSLNTGTVTPIDLATGTPGTPITVGENPDAIAITPDGKTAYVANINSDTVIPIDLATGHPGTPIKVGKDPVAIAITP
jgi:YVTN family beta-propeller protein